MPFYEYKCSNCGFELEELQSIKADPLIKCPKCGKDTLQRLIGTGGGLIFKGSGFYLTDYKNKSSKTAEGSKSSSEKLAAAKESIKKDTSSKPVKETKAKPNSKNKKESGKN
jgi:putative FmdB family regulatory protein